MSYIALHTGKDNQHCTLAWWPSEKKLTTQELSLLNVLVTALDERVRTWPCIVVRSYLEYFQNKQVAVLGENAGIIILRSVFSFLNESEFPGIPHVTDHKGQVSFIFNELRYHK